MVSDWAMNKAKAIVDDIRFKFNYAPTYETEWTLHAIATALREAARVPEGCVRDDKGVDRKVLGTLPVTADGAVVMVGQMVWPPRRGSAFTLLSNRTIAIAVPNGDGQWRDMTVGECYSTREAAQAALAARGEGK